MNSQLSERIVIERAALERGWAINKQDKLSTRFAGAILAPDAHWDDAGQLTDWIIRTTSGETLQSWRGPGLAELVLEFLDCPWLPTEAAR